MDDGGVFLKKVIALISILSLLLIGCTSNNSGSEAKQKEIDTEYLKDYSSNPQVTDDRTLIEPGQSFKDEKGEATLKAFNQVNKTYEVGPVTLRIKDLKLLHLRPDYSLVDYFHVLTHDEEFDFVKVFVEIENTSAEKVNFAPIALLETSEGEKFDWEKDMYLEDLNGELEANGLKKGNLGFIVEKSDNLEWIEITTSDVYDQNQKKIADSQKIKIEF